MTIVCSCNPALREAVATGGALPDFEWERFAAAATQALRAFAPSGMKCRIQHGRRERIFFS